jgi:uncharacterized membrane protein (UPF0127 family)
LRSRRRGARLGSCLNDRLHVPASRDKGGAGRRRGVVEVVSEAARQIPWRFRGLRRVTVGGWARVPVATSIRSRLLGLALLDGDRAGDGLLIPRCRAIHTFGMRFRVDVRFLDAAGATVAIRRAVPPRRLAFERRGRSVLEVPSGRVP